MPDDDKKKGEVVSLAVVGGGMEAVAKVIESAEPVARPPAPLSSTPAEPPAHEVVPAGEASGRGGGGSDILPESCPVTPLGVQGDSYWYLDALHQLREVRDKDHNKNKVRSLYGPHIGRLHGDFPRYGKNNQVIGWDGEAASEGLMQAAAARGVWDVFGRVRGPGGWLGEHGELVMHCGDIIVSTNLARSEAGIAMADTSFAPGRRGRYVYPASAGLPRPLEDRAISRDGAEALLGILKTWNWSRGETDAVLLLGWMGAALLGGALDWRPLVWLTGDKNTGKSTLQKLLRLVFGEAMLSVTDATEAGIRQTLGHASLPVALDEAESEEDNRTIARIVRLARQASSGGQAVRGGASHEGHNFTIRSCFAFSSINTPPLMSQDLSRIAVLDLYELPTDPGGTLPSLRLDPAECARLGQGLKRRLIEGWPRFAQTLETWRNQLAGALGHVARGADQYGTLLACADLLLFDGLPDPDTLGGWTEKLSAVAISERQDDASDHDRMVRHLLSSVHVTTGGKRTTFAELALRAAGREPGSDEDMRWLANKALQTYGLKVVAFLDHQWLAVANQHQGLAAIFKDTHWAGRSGAGGVWMQAAARVPNAHRGGRRIGGTMTRCWLLPLDYLLPPESETDAGTDG